MKRVELLSPAKDIIIGIAAINNGADAVYIGAPAFGARKAAANSIEDIADLVKYAHRFYCRVFVTLNTVLYDHELAEAEKMIHQLHAIGVDALIIQDMAILQMDLPPICLHASTQMHNYELDRIRFLDKLGFQRIVLARELSLDQLREIRREVKAELEVFIHGALCVSLSGQCYLSQYMFGRSANRGECAQPCRMKWSVKDRDGKILLKDKYALSLKDLNLSSYIDDLIDIGIDSFKIEGRLKEENYVANITNYYSSLINGHAEIERVGSGKILSTFEAEPERSFNRGYSAYFVDGRKTGLVNMDTPKSIGKKVGVAVKSKGCRLWIKMEDTLNNGDGLCYVEDEELKGIRVSSVEGDCVVGNENINVKPGTVIYRNYDHRFVSQLERSKSGRKISIAIYGIVKDKRFSLRVVDEDGVEACYGPEEEFELAQNPTQLERFKQQLMKCGDTDFECTQIDIQGTEVLFVPVASANAARRVLLERLSENRENMRIGLEVGKINGEVKGPEEADWHYNIANRKAGEFYERYGAESYEPGFEKNMPQKTVELMRTRYCLLYETGRCKKSHQNTDISFPLFLYNDKHEFRLDFDCGNCFMKVLK